MATEYISRDDALDCFACDLGKKDRKISYQGFMVEAAFRINDIPAADVRPVVRGKWKHDGSDWKNRFICDQCGYKWFFEAEEAHFCPNCGADMRPIKEDGNV